MTSSFKAKGENSIFGFLVIQAGNLLRGDIDLQEVRLWLFTRFSATSVDRRFGFAYCKATLYAKPCHLVEREVEITNSLVPAAWLGGDDIERTLNFLASTRLSRF